MAEMYYCNHCGQFINLEKDIIRDAAGNVYCRFCRAALEDEG